MLEQEASWIAEKLANCDVSEVSPIIMLGSRYDLYGPKGQSFIYQRIILPCEKRGIKFIHSDLEDGEGVDVAGDIFEDDTLSRLKELQARTIICANVLEHVSNPEKFASRCMEVIGSGGFAVVTVPYSFPYHPAPIDTQFRPDCDQIIKLLEGTEILASEQINCGSFSHQLIKSPLRLLKHVAQMLLFVPNYRRSLSAFHRNAWLFKSYIVSCVFAKKK